MQVDCIGWKFPEIEKFILYKLKTATQRVEGGFSVQGMHRCIQGTEFPSIKPLVFRIEFRDRDVDDFHFADGPVFASGADEDGGHGLEREELPVELHLTFTFEDEVDLSQLFVVMRLGVFLDVNQVDGRDFVVVVHEGPAGESAGTGRRFDIGEVRDFVSFAHGLMKPRVAS